MTGRNLVWLIGVMAVGVFGLAVSRSAPSRGRDSDYEMARLMVDADWDLARRERLAHEQSGAASGAGGRS